MNDVLAGAIAGVIQGFLEWLPVSSSGQVTLFLAGLVGLGVAEAYNLSMYLHLGTLASAATYFRRDVLSGIKSLLSLKFSNEIPKLWLVTTPLSLAVGFPLYKMYLSVARETPLDWIMGGVGVALIAVGLLLRFSSRGAAGASLRDASLRHLAILGVVQGAAVLPGVSRSGVTIAALLLMGFSPPEAVKTSFLASIPVILLAGAYAGINGGAQFSLQSVTALVTAFISGLAGILAMTHLAKKAKLEIFAIIMGAIILAFAATSFLIA